MLSSGNEYGSVPRPHPDIETSATITDVESAPIRSIVFDSESVRSPDKLIPLLPRVIDRTVHLTFLVEDFLVSVYETAGSYIQSNDDIRRSSFDERSVIVRTAANNVCCIGGAFIMHYYHLYSVPYFLHVMNSKYGRQTMDMHNSARRFIDTDPVLIKLAISMFAFTESTGCHAGDENNPNDLTSPICGFEIQSRYAEIAWKYLLYRYGQYQAVKRFLNLTLFISAMNQLKIHAQGLAVHLQDIDSIIEQTEIELIIRDANEIIEGN